MKNILVFCGSSSGNQEIYKTQSLALADKIVSHNFDLVYGAGNVGLMGVLADQVLKSGQKVIGIIPAFLVQKEVAHQKLSQLIVVDTMHQRKAKMLELADAVITLPGGFGTLEELFEILTAAQLAQHQKPIALLNVNGYFDPLIKMLDTMVESKFLKASNRDILLVSSDIDQLFEMIKNYKADSNTKWL